MGTRSVTNVMDEDGKTVMVSLYRQYDGYPEGHGEELAEFLKDMKIVNGISLGEGENDRCANGMGCLAAQIVSHFKDGIGGFYLVTPKKRHPMVDYIYTVTQSKPGFPQHNETVTLKIKVSGSQSESKEFNKKYAR